MRRLYSRDGIEYRPVEPRTELVLVYTQVEGDDGDQYDGELRLIEESALYSSPPKAKLNEEIAELHKNREDLSRRVSELHQELVKAEKNADGCMARLKQHKALAHLDDFLAGRITHYVESTYGPPKIFAFEDTREHNEWDRGHPKLKLLTLFGKTDGDLEWGLNRYSDGSGSYTTVTPCTSHSEALEVAGQLFAEHAEKALKPDDRTTPRQDWFKRATEYGIAMPLEYHQQLERLEAEAKQKKVEKLTAELAALNATDQGARHDG